MEGAVGERELAEVEDVGKKEDSRCCLLSEEGVKFVTDQWRVTVESLMEGNAAVLRDCSVAMETLLDNSPQLQVQLTQRNEVV